MFDFSKLKNLVDDQIPYTLFEDEKSLEDSMRPYRVGNEIVTPIFGIFRQNPSTLTAFQSPLIAVVSAIVEIASPSEFLQEVKKTMNDFVQSVNSTAQKVESDGNIYNVIIQAETCSVGQKRRDVGWYNGEIFPVSTVVTFTIYERGVASNYDGLKMSIDGNFVPVLQFNETRTASSEVAPDENAQGKVMVTQELYGVTINTPYIDDTLGQLVSEAISSGNANKAHAVTIEKNGERHSYLMCIGSSSTTAQPPLNIGFNLSLAEIAEEVANFSDIWKTIIVEGEVASLSEIMPQRCFVSWGDGNFETIDESKPIVHVYIDGSTRHLVRFLDFSDVEKFGELDVGKTLFGKEIRTIDNQYVNVASLSKDTLVAMDSGDTFGIVNSRLCMTIAGVVIPVDLSKPEIEGGANVVKSFTSAMRGNVVFVHDNFQKNFVYDRWSIGKEAVLSSADDVGAIIEQLLITANGTYTAPEGVDGYSPITVNVPIPDGYIKPTGAKEITENGTYDVRGYETANVNVQASGGGGENKLPSVVDGTVTEITADDLEGATQIKVRAFYECTVLTNVVIPSTVTAIGDNAFYGCTMLQSIEIPNSVVSITGYSTFYNCKNLKSLVIPDSVTELSINMCQQSGLETVVVGNGVTTIPNNAFRKCNLSSVTLGNAIETIGEYVFYDNFDIEQITIPASVTSIGSSALRNVSSQIVITMLPTTPPSILTNTFNTSSSKISSIIVPKGCGDSYKSATNWAFYASKIVEAET